MSRSYKNVHLKKHYVYSVDDLMAECDVVRNTVSNWRRDGLRASDANHPLMFNGAEVIRFHKKRRAKTNSPLRVGQFKCVACKGRVFPDIESVQFVQSNSGSCVAFGQCPDCGTRVSKRLTAANCDKFKLCIDTNTSLDSLDEEIEETPVGIVNDGHCKNETFYKPNDRIIHAWLARAGCWDVKTTDAKIATIRTFEMFCHEKCFSKLNVSDVSDFREELKRSVDPASDRPLSISTVRHKASHLRGFLSWLIKQDGYKGLNSSLSDYLELPKRFSAAPLNTDKRYVPTVPEAQKMLTEMPTGTIKERRDRAMLAIAFLGALRADTVTSLWLKHVNFDDRRIYQNAREVRAKNGKSIKVEFFPMPEEFEKAVRDWKEELLELGFTDKDALFPDESNLPADHIGEDRDPVPVMSSTHAIANAFKIASKPLGQTVTPHNAKHCIGNLGVVMCPKLQQFVLWSRNMGHDSVETTMRHYVKPSDDGVFEPLDWDDVPRARGGLSESEQDLLFKLYEYELTKGTPEFEKAQKLKLVRMQNKNP